MNDVTLYEREFPYLPGNVRTQLATVMARRGILNARNMPMVLNRAVYTSTFITIHYVDVYINYAYSRCTCNTHYI